LKGQCKIEALVTRKSEQIYLCSKIYFSSKTPKKHLRGPNKAIYAQIKKKGSKGQNSPGFQTIFEVKATIPGYGR
jgi:hypothetical protein